MYEYSTVSIPQHLKGGGEYKARLGERGRNERVTINSRACDTAATYCVNINLNLDILLQMILITFLQIPCSIATREEILL